MLSADMWERAGDLVSALGTSDFGPKFLDVFGDALEAEHCTVFAFAGSSAPSAVLAEARNAGDRLRVRSLACAFASGEFAHDPNVGRLRHLDDGLAVYTLAPDELPDQLFRRRFYDDPRIVDELVTLAHTPRWQLYLSFYRTDPGCRFRATGVDAFRACAPFAVQLLEKHVECATLRSHSVQPQHEPLHRASREQLFGQLREALLASGYRLTPREAEVCTAIALGYTVAGTGLRLRISSHTVATHRKRAYAKLGISSQNELFARYVDTLRAAVA